MVGLICNIYEVQCNSSYFSLATKAHRTLSDDRITLKSISISIKHWIFLKSEAIYQRKTETWTC